MLLWNWPLTFLTEKNITISFFMFVEIYDKIYDKFCEFTHEFLSKC